MRQVSLNATEAEERRLRELLEALRTPCARYVNPDSEILTPQFAEEFQSRLLASHCFLDTILIAEAFETAFIESAKAAKFDVNEAAPGQRFWDVEINGVSISLKSSRAKDLKAKKLHISKLCEAAWIQDCRTASKRQSETFELFEKYCQAVGSIIQFRYFYKIQKYQLVEFPVSLFQEIMQVGRSHFDKDGPTINIPIGIDPPYFTLKLDRSDAKITIANINIDVCKVLGEWNLG